LLRAGVVVVFITPAEWQKKRGGASPKHHDLPISYGTLLVLLEDFDYIDMDLYPERHLDRYNRRLYRRVECGQAQ